MTEKQTVQQVIKPLLDYYKTDKIKLIKLCLEWNIPQNKIAEALGIDESAVSLFLTRNKVR